MNITKKYPENFAFVIAVIHKIFTRETRTSYL